MGRRRKRRKKIVKKVRRPSRYFQCPRCGALTLTIDFKREVDGIRPRPGMKLAVAKCGNCGLYCVLEVPEIMERVDVYNKIADLVYEDRLDECAPRTGEEGEVEEEVAGEEEGEPLLEAEEGEGEV